MPLHRTPLCPLRLALVLAGGLAASSAQAVKPLPKKGAAQKGPAQLSDGTLLSSGRDVFVRGDASADWKEAEIGQSLLRRDRVRTGKASTATLSAGAGRLWLDPGTQLLLLGEKVKKGKTGVELIEGSVRGAVERGGPKGKARLLRIQTPEAEIRVRGTALVQLGRAAGELQVAVYDGSAEVVGKKGPPLRLAAGTGAALRHGAKPKVGGLIGAPIFETDAGLSFAVPQRGGALAAEIQLPFKPVVGAARYRLELARDEALTDRVFVGSVATDSKVATARIGGKGRYFARLQAIDNDQVPGPGPVQAVTVAEVRGERLVASLATAPPGQPRPVLLTGAGELAFDIVPASGRLQVQVDGKSISGEGAIIPLRVGRGLHRVSITTDGGQRGELRVEVSRPSYAVEINQDQRGKAGRAYRVEIHALDAGGQNASGGGIQARTAPLAEGKDQGPIDGGQALSLSPRGAGVYTGEVEVPDGQRLRLSVRDADGVLASAELSGAAPR